MSFLTTETLGMGPRLQIPCRREESRKNRRMGMGNWGQYHAILQGLYMTNNLPLPDVMKTMKEKYDFEATVKQCRSTYLTVNERSYRYQFTVKWGWKKYNQGGMRPTKGRGRRRRSRNPSNASEEELIGSSNESEIPCRDIASLRTLLSELFSSHTGDQESLFMLQKNDSGDISRCLRRCFRWCDEEIRTDKAQLPPPYGPMEAEAEIDIPGNKYVLDARVFIYLLDRYIGSRASSPEHDDWDYMANRNFGFCPIKMLCTMGTLIMVTVSKALDQYRDDKITFAPPYVFDVVKFGVGVIDRNGWGDKKLVTEFYREFEAILKDYANYRSAIAAAVARYVEQKWSDAAQVNEEDPGMGDAWIPDWPGTIPDEGPYSIGSNSLNGCWMGLDGGT
ncbi:hypothetical protein F5Y09DRAFT_345286 [Xylaria sp. FL1042]|nr:hypothetical protein F5Y09DRAFT_345286 [Xylaria sp. FL1042]